MLLTEKTRLRTLLIPCLAVAIAAAIAAPALSEGPGQAADTALRERAQAALRKAVEFYRTKVATEGGYHFAYAEDLSYGRSEMSEGPTRVEIQRDGTPLVGMAYLDAYAATGDTYYRDAARDVARALVKGQYCSGGWDYYIEFDPTEAAAVSLSRRRPLCAAGHREIQPADDARRQRHAGGDAAADAGRSRTRLQRRPGARRGALCSRQPREGAASERRLAAALLAIRRSRAVPRQAGELPGILAADVARAGVDYYTHYTFNDNSIVDALDAMLEAARIYKEPRYLASAEKGGEFMLLSQMPEPQPGWAQQYDRDMHPAWARQFEPPSITGGESQSVMRALMLLYRETGQRKYLEPLPRALAYYKRSILPDVENPSEIRRRACPGRTPCLARFYELKTNRPLYVTKGTRVTAVGQGVTNVDGYELSYSDQSVITHYAVLTSGAGFAEIEREYNATLNAEAASLKRPDRLHGLSPWTNARPAPAGAEATAAEPQALEPRVRAVIESMDARGAWLEDGAIGKANRLVSVLAGGDLVVTLGGKTLTMKENETLEVFSGPEPPKQRIIRSRTFADNVGVLSAYLARRTR